MNVCMVAYTSDRLTCCCCTFALSTSTCNCGTLGKYVGATAAISGRFLQAAMYLLRFCVRNERSLLPERSSRIIVTPPEVPTPGIDGGGKANPIPSSTPRIVRFRLPRIAVYCSSGFVLSAQSLRAMKQTGLDGFCQ